MFDKPLNVRAAKKFLIDHAHDIGLSADVRTNKDQSFIDFAILLEMNRQRFGGYCHKDSAGHQVMTDASRLRQIQAETKMSQDFWLTLMPALARARTKIVWFPTGTLSSNEVHAIRELRDFSAGEFKVNEPNVTGRTLRFYL